ncbi:uncharacterized protein LOC128772488 isoform X4 [Panthera pardus]|uniref:Uncharacterized protein LOC128772488 isoform X4 n=1 Tax=Panthera pardus TaxID=9691 RepID=A0A9W2VDQ5_PANPR|nr:uncharacterized protein LOC128772488 isoform X4 [Panthera pardus]
MGPRSAELSQRLQAHTREQEAACTRWTRFPSKDQSTFEHHLQCSAICTRTAAEEALDNQKQLFVDLPPVNSLTVPSSHSLPVLLREETRGLHRGPSRGQRDSVCKQETEGSCFPGGWNERRH